MGDVAPEYQLELAMAEDEQAVRALSACGPHPALGGSVCPRGLDRHLMTLVPVDAKTSS